MSEHKGKLALTRQLGEKIVIEHPDGNVIMEIATITVGGRPLRGGKVKLAFSAPVSVKIDRQEIWLENNQ